MLELTIEDSGVVGEEAYVIHARKIEVIGSECYKISKNKDGKWWFEAYNDRARDFVIKQEFDEFSDALEWLKGDKLPNPYK